MNGENVKKCVRTKYCRLCDTISNYLQTFIKNTNNNKYLSRFSFANLMVRAMSSAPEHFTITKGIPAVSRFHTAVLAASKASVSGNKTTLSMFDLSSSHEAGFMSDTEALEPVWFFFLLYFCIGLLTINQRWWLWFLTLLVPSWLCLFVQFLLHLSTTA